MKNKIIKNDQIVKIKARDLEKPKSGKQFDSTIDERERGYEGRKPMPRFNEYR